jgi:cystathionine beta-lyase
VPCDLDRVIDRRASDSSKWNRYDEGVLPLWVADMDFSSPEPVLRALRERVDHGVFGYAHPPAELYKVVRARLGALYGWEIAVEDLVFMPGVVVGFNLACHAVGSPGDGVLVQPPVYYPFLSAPENAGRVLQCAELRREGDRYEIDFDAFEGAITERTVTLLFCNPHNPVGRVYQRDELERLADICLRHDLVLCSDEIHCDLIYSGHRHLPIASLSPEVAARTITLMAPSKTFNVAGLKCSFAVIQNAALRERFCAARAGLVSSVNALGYVAALAAYQEGQAWLDRALAYLEANRDLLARTVVEELPGVEMILPEGTFLAWLDCRGAGIAGEPSEFFLREARVALNDGARFGPGGEGYVRLNFGCPRSTLVEALGRMRTALERSARLNRRHFDTTRSTERGGPVRG